MPENHKQFASTTAILRMPSWLRPDIHEEMALPFGPGDFVITPGIHWSVTAATTRQTVYTGIGPVELIGA